jgi:hypothetical protein
MMNSLMKAWHFAKSTFSNPRVLSVAFTITAGLLVGLTAVHAGAQVDYGQTLGSSVTPDNITGAVASIVYPGILPVCGVGASVFGSFWIYHRVRSVL